jgi:hypothetical protein
MRNLSLRLSHRGKTMLIALASRGVFTLKKSLEAGAG